MSVCAWSPTNRIFAAILFGCSAAGWIASCWALVRSGFTPQRQAACAARGTCKPRTRMRRRDLSRSGVGAYCSLVVGVELMYSVV